jgi:hypothetical protein
MTIVTNKQHYFFQATLDVKTAITAPIAGLEALRQQLYGLTAYIQAESSPAIFSPLAYHSLSDEHIHTYHFLNIWHASAFGDLSFLQLFAEHNPDLFSTLSSRSMGAPPLFIATQNGFPKVVQFLLEEGIDPNVENNGDSAIFMAAGYGFLEIVQLLIKYGANPDIARVDGATPLLMAVQEGFLEVVQFLIEQGANIHHIYCTKAACRTVFEHAKFIDASDCMVSILRDAILEKAWPEVDPCREWFVEYYLAKHDAAYIGHHCHHGDEAISSFMNAQNAVLLLCDRAPEGLYAEF